MISKTYLILLFIFIILLLIFGGYYLSTDLNKSLTSTSGSTQEPTQAPTQPQTQSPEKKGQIYFLLMMIGIWLFEIFSIIFQKN